MSLPDLTDDLTGVMDYLEPLTLRRADTAVETHIPQALRRVVSERESAASGGEILLADVHFHLPTSAVPSSPTVDDVLIDGAGQEWTILALQAATWNTRWNCLCRLVPPVPIGE